MSCEEWGTEPDTGEHDGESDWYKREGDDLVHCVRMEDGRILRIDANPTTYYVLTILHTGHVPKELEDIEA